MSFLVLGHVLRRNASRANVDFAVGDVVYTTPSVTAKTEDQLYAAEVIAIVPNDATKGLGVQYVLYVTTHVDDYVDLRSYDRVWASREEFAVDCAHAKKQEAKYKEQLKLIREQIHGQK